ncbi:MFS general substrate transporter [Dichomitus squalens LYAD-421 SS1]|uniref:MFS general substrate transporter n=1 Tax=Dichomitus squalens (strain LYAD-421) TaxID=732165 RepID=R7SV28_DICSQ|nr:MFS general substrate transporter [Dichomitus squalens LYAD-421 SS1]EJF60064.1 MFS general substrate transporter [Dichomitus squalens LYAD-421 SS1]
MHVSHSHANHPPPLYSSPRIISFLTCILVALASGTNYVAYGPQLGARLKLTHTQINIVGLSGNIGVYGTAPIWGGIVDRKGPRIMMVIAFFALLAGYLGIRHFYDSGRPDGDTISLVSFWTLVFFGFLTGIGGNGGLVGAMNATAKSWPDSRRATANGIVISGFGLSAFLFSTIAHTLFPGNTSEFLLVLAVGTALPMILGFFIVRPIPPPHIDPTTRLEHAIDGDEDADGYGTSEGLGTGSPTTYSLANDSHTHLLSRDADDGEQGRSRMEVEEEEEPLVPPLHHTQVTSDYVVETASDALMLSPTREGFTRHRATSARSLSRRSVRSALDEGLEGTPNIHGRRLFATANFWMLFTVASLLSGTGLMYINNVGAISQALFSHNNPEYDDVKAAQWQATQVSTISVMNCLGRISIGIIADFTKAKLRLPRSFCIVLVAAMFVISQVTCYSILDIGNLWKASALLGLAYGGLFGLFPTLTIEWFGLQHFSENWGFVSLSPMIGGNVFSIAFGRNLDAHSDDDPATNSTASSLASLTSFLAPPSTPSPLVALNTTSVLPINARGGIPDPHHCIIGRECYADSLKMTIVACCLALALGVYASWSDYKRHKRWASRAEAGPAVVIWESEE